MTRPLLEWIHLPFVNDPVPEKILFRVDAGRIWGLSFGHLSRCLTLSGAFRKLYKSENKFLMRNYPEGIRHATNAGQNVQIMPVELSRKEEREQILESIKEFHAEVLVVDLPYHDIDTSYFRELRKTGLKIIFIDDCRYMVPPVDVYLNSSLLSKRMVQGKIDNKTMLFLGSEYFIFDESLLNDKPVRKDGNINVVITFGGSDPAGLTIQAVETLLLTEWLNCYFWVILGPGYKGIDEIQNLLEKSDNFQIVDNPYNIIPFMQGCDICICAGGRSMYELVYLKKNFIPIPSAKHEKDVIKETKKLKLNKPGSRHLLSESIFTKLLETMNPLINNVEAVKNGL